MFGNPFFCLKIGHFKGVVSWNKMMFWQFYCIFGVLCIAKYRYGENIAANLNLKKNLFNTLKSPDSGLKNGLNVVQKNPKIWFFRGITVLLFFFYFLWSQAWSLNPLPEVFTLCGEGGGIRTRVSKASRAATSPMSYSRPKWAIPALPMSYSHPRWDIPAQSWQPRYKQKLYLAQPGDFSPPVPELFEANCLYFLGSWNF
jgi:hypothetical protein